MQLIFDSLEELKAFMTNLKGTRGGKNAPADDEGSAQQGGVNQAPAPLMPPQGGGAAFVQSAPAAFTAPVNAFPGQPAADPVAAGLVQRIVARIDGAIASGQPADTVLAWFRGQCGAEAAAATMDQIKTIFLPKLAVPGLEQIAKLMNA